MSTMPNGSRSTAAMRATGPSWGMCRSCSGPSGSCSAAAAPIRGSRAMQAVLLGAAALAFLALALHPFVTYPLSLRLLVRRTASRSAQAIDGPLDPPRVAICVCAYKEEACIERKMANLLELRARRGQLDILVYVDGTEDRTAELLAPFAEDITLVVSPTRHGKTHGMNLLVERCTADIVVFTDANVYVEPSAIDALVRAFEAPETGCVCGHLIYTN